MSKVDNKLAVFQGKHIRKIWHNNEWYFSVIDIIDALDASTRPRKYWSDLKKKLTEEGFELSAKIGQLKLVASDGKSYLTDCVSTKNTFRIIQSIPSKKAEPFKQWLAEVGYQRVQEIENPELAQKRMKSLYKAKGYSDEWIEKRVRGITIRDELTDEWGKRGVKTNREYSILTAEISKTTFGLTPGEYQKLKGLKHQNLRDHMNDLELIFNMLGEASTTKIARNKDALGFDENKTAAKGRGVVAGVARKELEKRSGEKVVSSENYLEAPEKVKKLKNKRKS
ncbi:Bro-N domain-containing protein [Candidatus Woesearchaeota archaeon]|nr:Bro-N domain-containing protein [Candidatus Woesearchaeota archaeon]